ncbi:hypothetical protein ASG40_17400 [Methylobacterium sp. Leaf399]|nr:hypothetical protein ASG40_17400 [Methylobacterium sp. Leaf399]
MRERAYHIWENEGRVFGRAEDHWLRAEAEFGARVATVESHLLVVQPSVPATSAAPSPAKTLKVRPARGEGVGAKAVTAIEAAAKSKTDKKAKTDDKATKKVAKAKTDSAKASATKASAAKASAAKSAVAKSAVAKSAVAKSAVAKSTSQRSAPASAALH